MAVLTRDVNGYLSTPNDWVLKRSQCNRKCRVESSVQVSVQMTLSRAHSVPSLLQWVLVKTGKENLSIVMRSLENADQITLSSAFPPVHVLCEIFPFSSDNYFWKPLCRAELNHCQPDLVLLAFSPAVPDFLGRPPGG